MQTAQTLFLVYCAASKDDFPPRAHRRRNFGVTMSLEIFTVAYFDGETWEIENEYCQDLPLQSHNIEEIKAHIDFLIKNWPTRYKKSDFKICKLVEVENA